MSSDTKHSTLAPTLRAGATNGYGAGMRIFVADWAAVQLDVRDHVFSINLLGRNQTTQNLELGLGATFFF